MPENTPNRGYTYPLYTDVANFPVQMQDFATDVDTDVEALENAINAGLNRPTVRASNGGVGQSITQNVDTAALFSVEDFDNAGLFNPGVSQSNFTVSATGLWLMSFRVSWADNNTGTGRECRVFNSTTTTTYGAQGDYPGNETADLFVASAFSSLLFATAGDVLQIILRHNATAAVNTTTRQASLTMITNL